MHVSTIMISNTNTSITTKVPWLGTITKDCVVVVRILLNTFAFTPFFFF